MREDNTDGRVVTVRMREYPATEVLVAAMDAVRAWPWRGDASVPVRLEYVLWNGGKVQHFPFGEVMWSQADADALAGTVDVIDAIACGVPVDPAARKAAATAAKHRAAKAKRDDRPAVDPASLVKPSLRFLLEADAREEAGRLLDRLEALPVGSPALAALADALTEDFPIMARADDALDGQLCEVLRQAGTLPRVSHDAFDALAVRWVAQAIRDGRPQHLTPTFVAGRKEMGLLDRALMEIRTLRWWMQYDAARVSVRQADPGPPVPVTDAPVRRFAVPASPTADDCPF